MKKIAIVFALVSAVASFAQAGVFGTFEDTSVVSQVSWSLTSGEPFNICKEVREAREDFNYFVASQGQVRTARFEHALAFARRDLQDNTSEDMEIAYAVLAEIN